MGDIWGVGYTERPVRWRGPYRCAEGEGTPSEAAWLQPGRWSPRRARPWAAAPMKAPGVRGARTGFPADLGLGWKLHIPNPPFPTLFFFFFKPCLAEECNSEKKKKKKGGTGGKKKKKGGGDSEAKAPSGVCICARETICMCVEMPEFVSSWVGGGGRGRNAGNQVGLRGEGLRQSLHPVVA